MPRPCRSAQGTGSAHRHATPIPVSPGHRLRPQTCNSHTGQPRAQAPPTDIPHPCQSAQGTGSAHRHTTPVSPGHRLRPQEHATPTPILLNSECFTHLYNRFKESREMTGRLSRPETN
uniref:Uncharacterized protein n=1 Tax=Paramormyrops kingsleyae TaxID=1676925 RepID=A0A3B3QIN2_9TELE